MSVNIKNNLIEKCLKAFYKVFFFRKVPPRKVLSMELVPLNRIKWLSTLVPPKATRGGGAKNNQNLRIFTLH